MKQTGVLLTVTFVLNLFSGGTAIPAEPAMGGSNIDGGTSSDSTWPLQNPCSFTQNLAFDLLPGGSLACGGWAAGETTDNQYLRVFDLDGEHGFGGQVCFDSLDYAVEVSEGDVELTFNVYCTRQGLADDAIYAGIDRDVDLDPGLAFSVTVTQADATLEYFNQPLGGCCDADTQDVAIEIASEDCLENGTCLRFYPGTGDFNTATKPYYIGAPDCGIDDPSNVEAINGFSMPELVMQVHATCGDDGDDGGDTDVPATTSVGAVLLLLILLGGGAHFLRRRAAS